MKGELVNVHDYDVRVVQLDQEMDLAIANRGAHSHRLILDGRNQVLDIASVERSYDGRSLEDIETPPDAKQAMREAVVQVRTMREILES